jgi:hypothetical protein
MLRNPMAYGIRYAELQADPSLHSRREEIIIAAARRLVRSSLGFSLILIFMIFLSG